MILNIKKSITIKLILLIVLGLLASMIVLFIVGTTTSLYIVNNSERILNEDMIWLFNIYALGVIVLPIAAFLTIFILGVRKRLNYLKYISNQVLDFNNIEDKGEIEVIGDDEIGRLARNINSMSRRIKESYIKEKLAEEEKNDLIVAVSHDLKTPLTSIIGYLDLIRSNGYSAEYVNIAYSKSLSLKNLIDQLFQYTKISNNYIQNNLTRCNIVTLINQIVGEYVPIFAERGIGVNIVEGSQRIMCSIDINNFLRAIENLFSNVNKYAISNSDFNIRISESEEKVFITLENKCIPFIEQDANKIFNRMYRGDSARNSKIEGSGLGLSITKLIIESHGGSIDCIVFRDKISMNITLNRI
ncbi:MAG: HAMP domain-containing sensor histidine kinase [Clostridium sp.]|uniref:sensor histidine kinase n=1 Tax=Clostridium sp. TaxID=1506 RepID=UPI002FC82E84